MAASASVVEDPFTSPPPPEVPLPHAPLVRVIAQLSFPEVLSVRQAEFVAPFQGAIREQYPVLRQEYVQSFMVGPEGAHSSSTPIWRFWDSAGQWRVSLAPTFLAIDTTRYTSRADFLSRLHRINQALEAHVRPGQLDRLGIRYVDRLTGFDVSEIAGLVRPEFRGLAGTPAAAHASRTLSEAQFQLENARLLARWGLLGPRETLDPAALEPIDEKSWVLDLDMSTAAVLPFSVERAHSEAQRYTERIYTVFRWIVTEAFLRRFGGEV